MPNGTRAGGDSSTDSVARAASAVTSYDIGRLDDLVPGEARGFELDGVEVAVVRLGNKVHAVGDVCTHQRISLAEGSVLEDACELECWKHGSRFSLLDGRPSCLPAVTPVPVYDVTIANDGTVTVSVP